MWEIFPFILNLKVKFVAGKWQLDGRGRETAEDWAVTGHWDCSS